MTHDDIQELRVMIAQIRCQLKEGTLPSGLVVCYADADDADSFERIADACEKLLAKEAKMSREECREVVEIFNAVCPSLPSVKQLTDGRIAALRTAKALLKDVSFRSVFEKVEASDFLTGRSGKWTGANFDWILKKANLVKILEGNYDTKRETPNASFDVNDFFEAALNRTRRVMNGT